MSAPESMVERRIVLSTQTQPKCANCGHAYGEHTAKHRRCPIGRRHRTLGFTQFHRHQFYKPRAPIALASHQRASQ